MLKVLVKKQIQEAFRGYFYDAKKNKARSKSGVIGMFILFAIIMVGVMGGMFTYLSLSLCGTMIEVGMPWLYFSILGLIAILMGAFGSVFNTFSSLYLAKDNDLLLSMPIPERTIVAARLIGVYLMGFLYSAIVSVPAVIVYWIIGGISAVHVVGGLVFIFDISLFVAILSCLLGWVVAKISLKLKRKSFATFLASLAFITVYYVFYFKAQTIIQDLLYNAALYGKIIKDKVYPLYVFGNAGAGDGVSLGILTVLFAAMAVIIWKVLEKTFLKIATSTGVSSKVEYKESRVRERSLSSALFAKEMALFTGNATYMLNCGLGILFLPGLAVFLLIKGNAFIPMLQAIFTQRQGTTVILFSAMFCMASCMNTMTAPAVSLEGKNLWIAKSIPVTALQVLLAKVKLQIVLTAIPAFVSAVIAACIAAPDLITGILMVLQTLVFVVCAAFIGIFFGVTMPIMNWTNPVAPIKQSFGVVLAMFVPAVLAAAVTGLYLWQGYKLGATLFLLLATLLYAAIALLLYQWTKHRGTTLFEEL